jgi:hypothetical protein
MGKYILNQETRKIELHFSKPEYMALSEAHKSDIRSNFLWSNKAGAWVSRSTNNHYWAIKTAEKIGLEDGGKIGERLSYAEEIEKKSERAEGRAERFEIYSDNAAKRAENLQADFNRYRKDWAWLTQPILAGHAGSQAFANHKNRVMARYERGFEEYEKSSYYQDLAATARATASNEKLKDRVYLNNRIKECNKLIKAFQGHIAGYEQQIYRVQNGEVITSRRNGQPMTVEGYEECIQEVLEKYEYEQDKLEFFSKCLADLGGFVFSKDNSIIIIVITNKKLIFESLTRQKF